MKLLMEAEISILSFVRPGANEVPIGILVWDRARNQLRARFRHDWDQVADEDDAELLALLADDLVSLGSERGAKSLLEYLEDVASHSIRVSPRSRMQTDNIEDLLDALYAQQVERIL